MEQIKIPQILDMLKSLSDEEKEELLQTVNNLHQNND